jgi:hypothetical protein
LALIVSCNKEKFTTEPQIKVKSIAPHTVVRGDLVQLKGSFTDDEGDIDSVVVVYKWYNGNNATFIDSIRDYRFSALNLPAKTREGEFSVTFAYGQNIGDNVTLPFSPVTRDTTATIGVIFKDVAGHRSNYAESDKIRLLNH